MKLAALGLIAVAVGIAIGEDGLALVGAIWVVLGTLLWTFHTRYEQELRKSISTGDPAVDALQKARARSGGGRYAFALVLVLAAGLAPLAIGIAAVGFADGSGWRWVPVAVGGLITLIGLLSAAVRLSGADLEAAAKAGEPQRAATVKKATVPHSALSDIGIGDGFRAEVDPDDSERIAIDWSAPIDGDAGADPAARLERLDDLRRRGLIDADEYEAQRRRIVESL